MNWKKLCKGCGGSCCGPVPFAIEFYEQNRDKIQRKPKDEFYGAFPGMVLPITDYANCVFLKTNLLCAVYKDRPEICKLYGTIPELKCPRMESV